MKKKMTSNRVIDDINVRFDDRCDDAGYDDAVRAIIYVARAIVSQLLR